MVSSVIAGMGATAIVVVSWLFKPLRRWKLFNCSMCLGFWMGTGCYLVFEEIEIKAIAAGFITSLLSYTWWLLMKHFINKYD